MQYVINYKLLSETGITINEAKKFIFTIGDGKLAKKLEDCIKDCEIGQLRTFLLNGEEVFGAYDESANRLVSFAELPENIQKGSAVDFSLPNGDIVIGTIKEITDDGAVVDFNHPLSNINISFIIKVLEIIS